MNRESQYAANDNLPHDVQAVYQQAFCLACNSGSDFCELCNDPARVEAARYAWSVVEAHYERHGDAWIAKSKEH